MFGRKSKSLENWKPGQPIYGTGEMEIIPAQPQYDTVLEWLVGLSEDDFAKVVKVAEINRKAYVDSQQALGEPVEPSTFIKPPTPELRISSPTSAERRASTILDEDDELISAFLEDDALEQDSHDTVNSAKQRKLAERGTKITVKGKA